MEMEKKSMENGQDMMIRTLLPGDAGMIAADWKKNFDNCFPMSVSKIQKKVFCAADFEPKASFCLQDAAGKIQGCIAVKISQNQKLYPDTAWITLLYVNPMFRQKGFGTRLINMSREYLLGKNIHMVFIGQDFLNLFSGIPAPDKAKEKFFEKMGFVLGEEEHFDLEADIICNEKIDRFDIAPFEPEFETACLERSEDQELLSFLHMQESLPDRWEFEAAEYLKNGGAHDHIVVLKKRSSKEICGFCMLQVDQTGYGGLGPIGIAESVRGRHVGDYMLRQSLCRLRKLGAGRTCIDWTILRKFYGQFDFEPIRAFKAGYMEL